MIAYMHQKYIAKAIEGVLMQETNFDYELIIADDASQDDTEKLLNEIIQNHKNGFRIKYTKHKKNIGMMPNFIWALLQCKGKYIALCEGDDYWTDPFKIQKQVDYLDRHRNHSICFHDWVSINQSGALIGNYDIRESMKRDRTPNELVAGSPLHTATIMFRNKFDRLPVQFSKAFNGDTFLYAYLSQWGGAGYLLGIKPSHYRVHKGGVWSQLNYADMTKYNIETLILIKKIIKTDQIKFVNHKIFRSQLSLSKYYFKELMLFKFIFSIFSLLRFIVTNKSFIFIKLIK